MYPNLRRTNLRYRGPAESEKFNHFYNNLLEQIEQLKTHQGKQAEQLEMTKKQVLNREYEGVKVLVSKPNFQEKSYGVAITQPANGVVVEGFRSIETVGILTNFAHYIPPKPFNDVFSFTHVTQLDSLFSNYQGQTMSEEDLSFSYQFEKIKALAEEQETEMMVNG